VLGLKLDIQFKGGAIVQYSFKGNASLIDKNYIQSVATKDFNSVVSVSLDTGGTSTRNYILVNMNRQITPAQVTLLDNQLTSKFTNSDIAYSQTTDVDPDMGRAFFQSSIFEVLLAAALIIIYIWFRFRKIGGLPAGITAFIALVHDVTMAFVVFSVFRIPINENFIAVALLILGYSINDTIVVYDRIRENRVKFGNKVHFKDIVNRSINQSFVRSVNTTLVTFVAITVVLIFSIIFKIDTIFSFALPMMVGVVTGCYSTICIAGPLWVTWVTYKEKKISPKGAAKKLTPKKV
jgi:preprotein translocase subunit SecF